MANLYFPFLELPGELRNQIYCILLKNTTAVRSSAHRSSDYSQTPISISASILRVSKQIYAEAMPLLYTLNHFNAHPTLLNGLPYLADSSRPVISAACSSLIRRFHLAVRLDCDPYWTTDDLIKAFSGVDELEVEAWQASFGVCDFSVMFAFSNIRGVGRARVRGYSIPSEFARWLEAAMESSREEDAVLWDQGTQWNVWDNGNR